VDEQQRETKLYARRGVLMPVLSEWEEDAEQIIFRVALFIVTVFTYTKHYNEVLYGKDSSIRF
jgi:hypothetical protein